MYASLAAQFASRADEADKLGKLPIEDVQALRESGYLTLPIPVEYGGQGACISDCMMAQLEIAQGSASTAMLAAMPLHIFGDAIETGGWSEQRIEEFSRVVVQDGAIFNAVASEPIMGSPSRGAHFATLAQSTEKGWRINGHKTWVTGGRHLTHLILKLMVEDDPGTILVLHDTPGLEWQETGGEALSLRASDNHDLYLNNVEVPHEALIERGMKLKHPNAWFPMMVGAVYLGSAIAARDTVIKFALERVPSALGKPIATLPKIQRQIGEMDIALQAAQALMLNVAHDWEDHPDNHVQLYPRIAAAKHYAVETALVVTELALKAAGAQGLTRALPLERYFRDVRGGSVQPPSGDTALELIGRSAIDRFGKI